MGYDMSMVNDPTDFAEMARVQELFNKAAEQRNALPADERGTATDPFNGPWVGRSERYAAAQAEVDRYYKLLDETNVGYFRLNIWGMGIARQIMQERGMIHYEGDHPDWPLVEDFGFSSENEYYEASEDDDRKMSYDAANRQVKVFSPEVPGIPAWKFGSNDGWVVTPIDIGGAMVRLRESGLSEVMPTYDGHTVDWWPDWIEWMNLAAAHGGFEVW
jgi:hypothetical protein